MAKGNRSRRAVLHPVRRFEMPYSSASAQLANPELGADHLDPASRGGRIVHDERQRARRQRRPTAACRHRARDPQHRRPQRGLPGCPRTGLRNCRWRRWPRWPAPRHPPELEAVIRPPFRRGGRDRADRDADLPPHRVRAAQPATTADCLGTQRCRARTPGGRDDHQPLSGGDPHLLGGAQLRGADLADRAVAGRRRGARVPSFPTLAQRLGPPAIGATDLPSRRRGTRIRPPWKPMCRRCWRRGCASSPWPTCPTGSARTVLRGFCASWPRCAANCAG